MLWMAVIPYFYYGTNQTIAPGATLITIPLVSMVADFLKHSFLPPANEVWGKVIFSATCVFLFGGGYLYDVTSCLAAWSHVPSGKGVSVPGPMFRGGVSVRELSLDRDSPIWWRAGGMHPTGMLPCWYLLFWISEYGVFHLSVKYQRDISMPVGSKSQCCLHFDHIHILFKIPENKNRRLLRLI